MAPTEEPANLVVMASAPMRTDRVHFPSSLEDRAVSERAGQTTGGRGEEELLKIGDFARRAGTNLRTLRYYEEIGLLHPATRSSGGFRYYRAQDLDRLRMVAGLQQLGLDLARIRELMDTRAEGLTRSAFMERVRGALRAQVSLIDERVKALAAQRDELGRAMDKLAECDRCDHSPTAENNFCHPCQVDGKLVPPGLSALF
jgi:DNA-binding transcriptional MerR regulator